jgi:predicted amidohydrolase
LTLEDKRLAPLIALSRRVDLVVGMVLRSDDFRYFNAAVYLADGEVTHVHRKVYLPTYGMFDEQRYFAPGDRIRAFNHHRLVTGILVCEDMWHLSAPYLLFVQGTHLLICPSVSPGRGVLLDTGSEKAPGSVTSWHELCRTIAAFTVSYVAYCNRVGYEDGVNFGGGSGVWGPDGKLLAEGGAEEEMTWAEIDLREVERQRQATPLVRDEKIEFTLRELERVFDEQTSGPY